MNEKKFKRDELYIYYEVLKTLLKNPMRATHIMRVCNLDTRLYKHTISKLVDRGLVDYKNNNGIKMYYITDQGRKFVEHFESILSLMSTSNYLNNNFSSRSR